MRDENESLTTVVRRIPFAPLTTVTSDETATDSDPMIYIPSHLAWEWIDLTSPTGHEVAGLHLASRSGENSDSAISPGGQSAAGVFRLGFEAGFPYTLSASVYLHAPLKGKLLPERLSILFDPIGREKTRWMDQSSPSAVNLPGVWNLTVPITVPQDAVGASCRLQAGMATGGGSVVWTGFSVTNGHKDISLLTSKWAPCWQAEEDADIAGLTRYRFEPGPLVYGFPPRELLNLFLALRKGGYTSEALSLIASLDSSALKSGLAGVLRSVIDLETPEVRRTWPAALSRVAALQDHDLLTTVASAYEAAALADKDWGTIGRVAQSQPLRPIVSLHERLAGPFAVALMETRHETEAASLMANLQTVDDNRIDWRDLFLTSAHEFSSYLETLDWLDANMDSILNIGLAPLPQCPGVPPFPVFVYWDQGFAQAPRLIRSLLSRLYAETPPGLVIPLDWEGLTYFIDVPDIIKQLHSRYPSQSLAWARIALLRQYGGVWLDPTTLVGFDWYWRLSAMGADQALLTVRKTRDSQSTRQPASWFMATRRPGHPGCDLLYGALTFWLHTHEHFPENDFFSALFVLLGQIDPSFSSTLQISPTFAEEDCHRLQQAQYGPYREDEFRSCLKANILNKMTVDFDQSRVGLDSTLAFILRNSDDLRSGQTSASQGMGVWQG